MAKNDFDWDKYDDAFDWNQFQDEAHVESRPVGVNAPQAALEGFGKGATLGYLPHLQAMAEPITDRLFNLLPGEDVEPASFRQMIPGTAEYIQARDANIRRQQAQSEEHPVASTAGEIFGIGATSALPAASLARGAQAARARSIGRALGQTGKGTLIGAAQAAAINPGDVAGEFNPLQLEERLSNAKTGALIGATGGAIGTGLKRLAPGAKSAGEQLAVKSAGAMLKDFRQVAARGELNKLGRWLLDKGIVKSGDTVDTIAEKAAQVNREAGKRLDDIYNRADGIVKRVNEKIGARWQELTPKELSFWKNIGFNPKRDKSKILGIVKRELKNEPGAKAAIAKLENYLDDLIEQNPDKIMTPKQANDIKSAVDRAINWARNPLTREPNVESAYKAMRTFLNNKISKQIDAYGKTVGDKNLAKALKDANRDYGFSKRITTMAEDRALRNNANMIFGLPEVVVGGGALAGGGTGAGLLGLAATKAARRYGAPFLAQGLDMTSKAAARGANVPPALAAPATRLGLSPGFYDPASEEELALPPVGSGG